MKVLSIIAALALSAPAFADTYKIDPGHSPIVYKISHMGFSSSYGMIPGLEGKFTLDDAKPEKSSVEFSLKMDALYTGVGKRDEHLKSPDFFNVKQFPTTTFKSKSVKKTGDQMYEVTGDLTMHGVTKPVTFNFHHLKTGKDPMGGIRAGGDVTMKPLKRSDFGMNFMQGGVGDEVELMISVEGTKI